MSNFVDSAQIHVKAGDGGAGSISFRREAHVDKGGPDGGDGGAGGDVWLQATHNFTSLFMFRDFPHRGAENGSHGQGKKKHGITGKSITVEVPIGTVVKDLDGRLVVDLDTAGARWLAAKGGQGGRGNTRFLSNSKRAPSFAEQGEEGEEFWFNLELKLAADIAIIGFPNVGKSTLISVISAAKPKIADYPFTTLIPNLGVVRVGDRNDSSEFIVADIPGLIEGASEGKGLGHEFLRHIERAKALLVLIDPSPTAPSAPAEQLNVLMNELEKYMADLVVRPRLVVVSKIDTVDSSQIKDLLDSGLVSFAVSSATGEGIKDLVNQMEAMVTATREVPKLVEDHIVIHRPIPQNFEVVKDPDGIFRVKGRTVERTVAISNITTPEAIDYIQSRLKKLGVDRALKRSGVREGDEVRIAAFSFEYQENL
ncbi:MAG: GTPase ObgE [Acidimicrobiaceae bacterium]|nr:GTPase ObgE [Acidimicrobiaceae bacterium]